MNNKLKQALNEWLNSNDGIDAITETIKKSKDITNQLKKDREVTDEDMRRVYE